MKRKDIFFILAGIILGAELHRRIIYVQRLWTQARIQEAKERSDARQANLKFKLENCRAGDFHCKIME